MTNQPSAYSWLKPPERNWAHASSNVTDFMRCKIESGTFGRPSGKRSPFQSGVYWMSNSRVKMPG